MSVLLEVPRLGLREQKLLDGNQGLENPPGE